MTEESGERWFILNVRQRQEKLAANFLGELGIGHRNRETERTFKTARGPVRRMVAALPGYLPFICPEGEDPAEYRDRACACLYIKGLFVRKSDGKPLQLRPNWEEQLRLPRVPEGPPGPIDYAVNDRVQLTTGPLLGLLAQCVNIGDGGVTVEFAKPFLSTHRVIIRPQDAKRAA
jgi:hypothetical protein